MSDGPEELRRQLEAERRARSEAEAISERATSELSSKIAELAQANEKLEKANEAIREFAAVASHDIRNPLTFIIGTSQLLRDSFDAFPEATRTDLLSKIVSHGEMLGRLVDDLLTVSKLDAGAIETHIENVKIGLELDRVMTEMGPDAGNVTVNGEPDLEVRADPDHVQRILTNYLTNALKYGDPPIVVQLGSSDGFVEIRVLDRGPGVPPDFAPRLFGKFARAEGAAARARGTGLGLSIVRGLAVANGGEAWYEPNVPNGSCFVVRLPLALA